MFKSSPQPQHKRSSENEVPMDTVSSQLTVPSSPLWDVFLTFYGKDTRRNFISNLYYALDQAGIVTFRDEPALEKGEEISTGLRNAIKNSKMFVVVISENYARSSWCLDELVEILRCKRTKNQVVPVFYYVDPSDLRYQKGCFSVDLKIHKKRYSVNRIEKWKAALTEIADLSGYHLEKDAKESEAYTIQKIVEGVTAQASSKVLHHERYLFGIDIAVEEIYQQLSMESDEVRALGICGMGGIGKTTLAKAFYNKYSHKFDRSCFMENAKQNSKGRSALLPLLEQLLIELLRVRDYRVRDVESAVRKLKEILSFKKALIVIDDLDQSSYSELLVRICKLFSKGSRVIITARDANLPNQLKVEMSKVDIYMVKQLDENDSLELFSYHAFKKSMPPINYHVLSKRFVTYAGGLPLALKVLGSSLLGRTDVSFWKAKLEKIHKIPVEDIHKILKLSYDELDDETEKAIFLDIVFFFVGKNIKEAVDVFKSCDFFPEVGIPILVEKCLLTIDVYDRFQMHNLIQGMGWNVIREDYKHGKCKRLYLDQEEACQALQNLEGINNIEGLILDLSMSTNKFCNAKIFERMPNLRLLKFIGVQDIEGNFKTSFHELRCISWYGCPWTNLPSSVHLQKLVYLDMPFSRFRTLWKDAKLPSLRHLNLDGCIHLKELPESIGQLTKLDHLNLHNCGSLKRLPKPMIQLTTLGRLDMSCCSNLKLLPEQLGDMKGLQMLDVSDTAIERLPDSIAHLKKLVKLNLCGCQKLKKLPEQFGNMEGLETFDADKSGIEQLPDSFSDLPNLLCLYLSRCTNLTSLPDNIWKLKCLLIDISLCSQLKRLPEQFGKMQCLQMLEAYNTAIEELPNSIGLLPWIFYLNFASCDKLTYVPDSIRNLTSLKTLILEHKDIRRLELPDAVDNTSLESLTLTCNVRVWLPMILSFSSVKVLRLYDEHGSLFPTKSISFVQLFNLEHLVLNNCASHGSSFPELPLNLETLEVYNHVSLEQVPDLSNLKQLKRLYISRCRSLQSLRKLPPHLLELKVCDCKSLQDLPDLSLLRDLVNLIVTGNGSTLAVSLEESNLQVGPDELSTFKASLQNREVAEWFNYKSSGCTVSFDIPSILGDDFVGVGFWVVYHTKHWWAHSEIEAVIMNKTEGMTKNFTIKMLNYILNTADDIQSSVGCMRGDDMSVKSGVQSNVQCLRGDDISVKSGDKIQVSFQVSANYLFTGEIKMCGVHLILKTPSTFTSF